MNIPCLYRLKSWLSSSAQGTFISRVTTVSMHGLIDRRQKLLQCHRRIAMANYTHCTPECKNMSRINPGRMDTGIYPQKSTKSMYVFYSSQFLQIIYARYQVVAMVVLTRKRRRRNTTFRENRRRVGEVSREYTWIRIVGASSRTVLVEWADGSITREPLTRYWKTHDNIRRRQELMKTLRKKHDPLMLLAAAADSAKWTIPDKSDLSN